MQLNNEDQATLNWLRIEADRWSETAIKGDDPWAKNKSQYARLALQSFVNRKRDEGYQI